MLPRGVDGCALRTRETRFGSLAWDRARQERPRAPLTGAAVDQILLAAVKFYLIVPSLIMNGIYALGPVIAPLLFLAAACAFPFIALRDKPDA